MTAENNTQASIVHLLNEASKCLARFLEKLLPLLFNDWWKQAVVNNLSYQQQRRIEQHHMKMGSENGVRA